MPQRICLRTRHHRTFEAEYEITTQSGETKWVWEQGEGVYDETGQVLALEGFIIDITARKHAEAERERLTHGRKRADSLCESRLHPNFGLFP